MKATAAVMHRVNKPLSIEQVDLDAPARNEVLSILELCLAKGVPSRMLNWHYRSKHQSLIAVSNRESTRTSYSSCQVPMMLSPA